MHLESTLAAVDYLSAFSGQGKKVFIFGDMLELGDVSREQHIAIGEKCDEMELSAVLTYGKETIATSESIKKVKINQHFDSKEELIDFLQKIITSNDKILIKGSRGMRMETIIQGVMEN